MNFATGISVRHIASIAALLSCGLLFAGCESADDRKIASGLACLDTAKTSDDAETCLSKVEGLESPKAYLIRCSANFVAQGFMGQRVADAFQKLKENPSGQAPTTAMMAYFVFAKNLPNHTATRAITNCTNSGVKSMLQLATAAQLATFVANPFGGIIENSPFDPNNPGSFDEEALHDQLASLSGGAATPEQLTQIGSIAQTAQSAYCGEGSSFKEQDICTRLDAAISGNPSSLAAIGQALLSQLSTP